MTYASESITLEWVAPVDTGCREILDYEIEMYDSVADEWQTVGSTGSGDALIGVASGLPAGQLV